MSDIIERAKAALEGVAAGPWRWGVVDDDEEYLLDPNGVQVPSYAPANMAFIAESRALVPELVAEVERLRAGGPWVEHVEYMAAMKRSRDGECTCDGNPATTDGPDEFCPYHGRSYRELVEIIERQAAQEQTS